MTRILGEWASAAVLSAVCLLRFLGEDFLARPAVNDRGTFILYGKLIAEGAVPYRDFFDNKPPMIYLLGALAWSIVPSPRAVYQLERVALLLLAAAIFALLRYGLRFRLVPALVGLFIGLVTLRNPEAFNGGHLTEEYGILFEVAAMTCMILAVRRAAATGAAPGWACAAGVLVAFTLLTRQTFFAALLVIWAAVHAPLLRSRGRMLRLVGWELAGIALPLVVLLGYLWWVDGLARFLELLPESWAYVGTRTHGTMGARLVATLRAMVDLVFHRQLAVAIATAVLGLAAVAVAVAARTRRRESPLTVTPVLLPLWFVAELVVAAAPGTKYGHYYLAFVPLWACLFALVAELLWPRRMTVDIAGAIRVATCVAMVVAATIVLDAAYRTEPTEYWFLFAQNPGLPPPVVARLRDDASRFGWRRYVPLDTLAPEVLFDVPLTPGTRFLAQYPYQFPGPDSARGREFLADLAAADLVIYDKDRLGFEPTMEVRMKALLRSAFTPLFEWTHFQFLGRRDATDAARGADAGGR